MLQFTKILPSRLPPRTSTELPLLAQIYRLKAVTERMQANCEHISKIWTYNFISQAGFGVLSSDNQCCKLCSPNFRGSSPTPSHMDFLTQSSSRPQFTALKVRWSFLLLSLFPSKTYFLSTSQAYLSTLHLWWVCRELTRNIETLQSHFSKGGSATCS